MDKKDQSQNENRTYFRLELSEPVKVYGECDSFEEVFGDISKTGLMFLSGKKFKIDEEITFGLNHPTEGNFKINGIVKRIRPKKIDLEKANSARHFFLFYLRIQSL